MTATFYVGDAIEVMSKLPERSVDLVLTSPPFLALRSYLPSDHPDKALEGGSQSTPGEFIDWLIDVVEACDRVLAPHGSLCLELGDTYSGSGGAGGDYGPDGLREGQPRFRQGYDRRDGRVTMQQDDYDASLPVGKSGGAGWPLAKSLSLIPELFRLTLVYGTNPLTGRQTDRWRLRNVVRWVRPNPPVGALGDKFRPATSELMVFCKSAKRFFDLDSVREPYSDASIQRSLSKAPGHIGTRQASGTLRNDEPKIEAPYVLTHSGAPPLDWWNIPLLEGEPVRGGPKVRDRGGRQDSGGRPGMPKGVGNMSAETYGSGLNHLGAPPLDWWNFPLPEGIDRAALAEALTVWDLNDPQRNDAMLETIIDAARTLEALSSGPPNPAGAPPLDWWNIPPGGYEGAHYAVFPPELCIKPIKAMCPERVCRLCGEPSRRIVGDVTYEPSEHYTGQGRRKPSHTGNASLNEDGVVAINAPWQIHGSVIRTAPTLGFSDCGHDDWRPGVVLDPFVGSGTTLMVATGHGRDAIGIDLDERNFELALNRVGPFILERADMPDKCQRCDGSGWIPDPKREYPGDPCPACHGSGNT